MPLILCLICDRQREVWLPPENLVCSNCGVPGPKVLRDRRSWDDWSPKDGVPKIEAQTRTLAALKWLRDTKGHKPGFANAKFRSIFGYWPPREIEDVEPSPPVGGLMKRIASDNIAWKKQKRAEEAANPTVVAKITPPVDYAPSFMTADDWAVKL